AADGPGRSPESSTIQSLLDRANAATLANQPDLAARLYRQAIAQAAADNPQRVVAHLGLGLLLNQQGEPAQAIAQFDQAIALAPTSAIGYELRGLALFDLQRWDEAIASLQQAIERDPKNPSIRVSLANVLYDRQDFEQAIAQLRLVIDLMPNHPQPHYNLGLALQDRGQLPEAIAEYEKALAIDPLDRDIRAALDQARAALQSPNPPSPPPD
ncbi:MAG TPA: tetratricopeptide repeat protein, partial [Coleofasciculaceae cyanobacterium]